MNVFDYLEFKFYIEFTQSCIVFNWATIGAF